MTRPDLSALFAELNIRHFDGFLDAPILRWNTRLRTSAGRFMPGSRKWILQAPSAIEVATYLLEEARGLEHIRDTMAHEMIHYWLWVRRRPYGHTAEFMAKMKEMGASRYNPVPRRRPDKYLYRCAHCAKEFRAKRKLGTLACGVCCKAYSGGRYDHRFRLVFDKRLEQELEPRAEVPRRQGPDIAV